MLKEKIFDSDFKGVIVSDILYEYLMATYTDKPFQERLRNEIINVEMCGMIFPRHHHYVGILDEMSLRLFDSGIISYEIKNIHQFDGEPEIRARMSKHMEVDKPKIL